MDVPVSKKEPAADLKDDAENDAAPPAADAKMEDVDTVGPENGVPVEEKPAKMDMEPPKVSECKS